jgi:hypothetical protein
LIINARKQSKRMNSYKLFLPLSLGNIRPGIHRCSNESTRRDKKKGVLVNTPTLAWAYTRRHLKTRERTRPATSVVSPLDRDAVYLNKGLRNIFTKNGK